MASQLVSTTVNGDVVQFACPTDESLLNVLRDNLVLQVPRKAAVQAIAVRAALLWMGD